MTQSYFLMMTTYNMQPYILEDRGEGLFSRERPMAGYDDEDDDDNYIIHPLACLYYNFIISLKIIIKLSVFYKLTLTMKLSIVWQITTDI